MNTLGDSYKPSPVVVLGMRMLSVMKKLLPAHLYGVIYDFAFSAYRAFIRLFYLRRWLWSAITGDTQGRRRAEMVFEVMPYSMVGWPGLEATYDVVLGAYENGVPGSMVECGVARGGSAALMALVMAQSRNHRKLWLFDSYEGLPEPTEEDFQESRTGRHIQPLSKGSCLGTYEQVENLLFDAFRLDRNAIVMVKGWFQDTLPVKRHEIGSIAVLRLDGDWYESTKCCLENLYDEVVGGGYVIIDDYNSCFGAQKAVDEFLDKRNVRVELVPDGRGGCYFVKPT